MKSVLILSMLAVTTAFQAPASLQLRRTTGMAASTALRRAGATSTSMLMMPNEVYTAATSLLLAFDPDGSKTDRLYNGIPATGAVEAPAWALPVLAVSISAILAIVIPLLLKPGSDAFNNQRNDIGVFSNKDKDYK